MAVWRRLLVSAGLFLFGVPSPVSAQETSPPRSFEAIASSPTAITLYWLPASGATGYRVERDGQPIATLPATAQTYVDSGLAPDSTHRYALRALVGAAESTACQYVERSFAPFPAAASQGKLPEVHYDVAVFQASTGGVAAAIEAARRGRKVALFEPSTRVGGMPANGLSATDLRRPEHASGFFVHFRDRIQTLYAAEGVRATGMSYEPRVAQQAMKSLLYEVPGVTLYRRVRPIKVLSQETGDSRKRIRAVQVEALDAQGAPTGQRAEVTADVFIDSTDCGDIAAWAGAPFRVGREARSKREPHNGVIYYDRANDRLLPGSAGRADRRVMSYAYLLVVKDYGPGADRTIPKPPGYRRENYLHAPAWKESWAVTSGRMPNGKYELNQHPQGNDLQEINYGYPTDDYAARARIERQYRDHVLGYLYYIQTEQGQKQIGLPDDEYRDTGGFPPLLYVREGRRILGEQLPQEADITEARALVRPESIGLGDYPMDSHAVETKTDWTTPDMGEGEWWLYKYTPWHELPLGILVPRCLDNVFVTTAVSSTHVSFGTYRLEPVRMAFGEAAGIAADLCLRFGLKARDVPARQIQEEMLPHSANRNDDPEIRLTYYSDLPPDNLHYRAIEFLAVRGIRLPGETFRPEAPTTRGELAALLERVAERAAPPPHRLSTEQDSDAPQVVQAFYPYMGALADRKALEELRRLPPDVTLTRAEIAHWIVRILPTDGAELPRSEPYLDVTDPTQRSDCDTLYGMGIDSALWDGWNAFTPERKQRFQPNAPLRHDALMETLYIAQIGLGPLFYDHPLDGRNGRATPPALYEIVPAPR